MKPPFFLERRGISPEMDMSIERLGTGFLIEGPGAAVFGTEPEFFNAPRTTYWACYEY